jgi:hypothetical protein
LTDHPQHGGRILFEKRINMHDCVVYTINLGERDKIGKSGLIIDDIPYLYVTDGDETPPKWRKVLAGGVTEEKKILATRELKAIPEILLQKTDNLCTIWTIYHDANLRLKDHPMNIIEKYTDKNTDIALFMHDTRNNIIDEGKEIVRLKKAREKDVNRLLTHLQLIGNPIRPLYYGGFIIRRMSLRTFLFNIVWWENISAFCLRDQLSLPYATWKTKQNVSILPGSWKKCDFLDYESHG